jgi:hypothetical protein
VRFQTSREEEEEEKKRKKTRAEISEPSAPRPNSLNAHFVPAHLIPAKNARRYSILTSNSFSSSSACCCSVWTISQASFIKIFRYSSFNDMAPTPNDIRIWRMARRCPSTKASPVSVSLFSLAMMGWRQRTSRSLAVRAKTAWQDFPVQTLAKLLVGSLFRC